MGAKSGANIILRRPYTAITADLKGLAWCESYSYVQRFLTSSHWICVFYLRCPVMNTPKPWCLKSELSASDHLTVTEIRWCGGCRNVSVNVCVGLHLWWDCNHLHVTASLTMVPFYLAALIWLEDKNVCILLLISVIPIFLHFQSAQWYSPWLHRFLTAAPSCCRRSCFAFILSHQWSWWGVCDRMCHRKHVTSCSNNVLICRWHQLWSRWEISPNSAGGF